MIYDLSCGWSLEEDYAFKGKDNAVVGGMDRPILRLNGFTVSFECPVSGLTIMGPGHVTMNHVIYKRAVDNVRFYEVTSIYFSDCWGSRFQGIGFQSMKGSVSWSRANRSILQQITVNSCDNLFLWDTCGAMVLDVLNVEGSKCSAFIFRDCSFLTLQNVSFEDNKHKDDEILKLVYSHPGHARGVLIDNVTLSALQPHPKYLLSMKIPSTVKHDVGIIRRVDTSYLHELMPDDKALWKRELIY